MGGPSPGDAVPGKGTSAPDAAFRSVYSSTPPRPASPAGRAPKGLRDHTVWTTSKMGGKPRVTRLGAKLTGDKTLPVEMPLTMAPRYDRLTST